MLLQLSRGPVSENLRSSIIGSDGWLQNIIVLRNSSLAGLFTDRAAGGAPRPRMNFLMLLSLGLEIQILALERRGKRAKDSRSSWLIAESYWFWTAWSRSRTALWELDNLRRSLHLLNYVELTQFQRNIQRADRASVDRKCPRARGIASCLAGRTGVAAGRPRRPGACARRDDASDRRGRECRRRARPGNDATGWIDRHLSAQRHQDWRHRGGGTGGDLGARAWRRLRAALFLLRTGLPRLASLHLAAAFAPEVAFELFFGDLQASPYHDAVRASQGRLSVPPGPGLGLDPDMEVLNRYRLGPPVVIES